MALTKTQLSTMVNNIRNYPTLTREQFYGTIGLPEQEVQSLTQMLVDLGQVQANQYDEIAPWVRGLNQDQVSFWIDSIFKKYEQAIRDSTREQVLIDMQALWEKLKRQRDKMAALTDADPEIQEGFQMASRFFESQADQCERRLRSEGVLEPLPDELQEA